MTASWGHMEFFYKIRLRPMADAVTGRSQWHTQWVTGCSQWQALWQHAADGRRCDRMQFTVFPRWWSFRCLFCCSRSWRRNTTPRHRHGDSRVSECPEGIGARSPLRIRVRQLKTTENHALQPKMHSWFKAADSISTCTDEDNVNTRVWQSMPT